MKRILFLSLFLYPSFSLAQIHYVSNQGSYNGNGSLTNPFNKISVAYAAAVSNGQNEVIKLMPGNYYETNILIFNNKNITISGYGDQSIISNNIIVKANMSFTDLQINGGSFSNESFVIFNNVKCDDSNIDIKSISGTWRGKEDEMHINFLSDPNDELEVVNYLTLSNYVEQAGLATENDINIETAARETADNLLSADIISAMDVTINTVSGEYLKLDGGTLNGDLILENNVAIRGKDDINDDGGGIMIVAGSSMDAMGGDIIINAGDGGFGSDDGGYVKLYSGNSAPETRAEMILEGGKYSGGKGGISTKCSFFRVNDIDIVDAINNAMSSVQKSGGFMTGNLSAPNINLIPTVIEGYIVSSVMQVDMNGLYINEGDIYNNQPVYRNDQNWVLYSNGGGLWLISSSLGGPMYDYGWSFASPPTVPLSGWMFGSSVSVNIQTNFPMLNFAAGKAINLQDGVDPQDAATVGQLDNKIATTKDYVDSKITNVIVQNINIYDGRYVGKLGAQTMEGPLNVSGKIKSGFGVEVMEADNTKAGLSISPGGAGQLNLYDDQNNLNSLLNSDGDSYLLGGRLGIGTSPTYGQLEIRPVEANADHGVTLYMGNGATARSFLQSDGNDNYNWHLTRTASLDKGITIDVNGNIGIATGTNTPQAKLDVNGDANISGTLTVPQIYITGGTDWNIGSANQCADIVIKNPDTEIRSENGDVILNAAANSIVMKSPVKFSENQFGSATIPSDYSSISVNDKNVSGDAVILLTPCGEVSGAPYAQINTDGTFDIKLPDTVIVPTVINYLILEK